MTVVRWAAAIGVSLLAAACLLPAVASSIIAFSAFPDIGLDFLYASIELVVSAIGGALLIVAIRMIGEAREAHA